MMFSVAVKQIDQLEVLVDHADAQIEGILGEAMVTGLPWM